MQALNATMPPKNSIIVLSCFILKSLLCIWLCFSRDKRNYCGIFWIPLSVFERKLVTIQVKIKLNHVGHRIVDSALGFSSITFQCNIYPWLHQKWKMKNLKLWVLNIVQNRVLVIFFLFPSRVQEYYEKYLCECKLPTYF